MLKSFFIAGCCTDGSQDSSIIELRIAITTAETLARNAVDFLTVNNTTTNTIVRCIEVEFHKAEQLYLRYPGVPAEFHKAIMGRRQ